MLDRLSAARRRLYLGLLTVLVVAVAAVLVAVIVGHTRSGAHVTPVAQDVEGPVLLVPGYGGSSDSLGDLAAALRGTGRDVTVADLGDTTGDLRDQAARLDDDVRAALARTGAPSVDVVGYSAGGVAVRYWTARLDGASLARRVVTISSPHHGTELAALGGSVAPDACPVACRQLAPDSDLLRDLDRGDETPDGPLWVAMWTEDDRTVVPPVSGSLVGAVDFSVQSICPGVTLAHGDMPHSPVVIAIVVQELGLAAPVTPTSAVC